MTSSRRNGSLELLRQAIRARPAKQRVVVTGLGAITSLGLTVDEYWQALLRGESGIVTITQFDARAYPTQIAGSVPNFDPSDYMDRRDSRRMSRFSQMAVAAAGQALDDAGLARDEQPERRGVLLGCAIGGLDDTEAAVDLMRERGGMRVSPFFIVMVPPNMAAFHVAQQFRFLGYNNTCVTACAAGTQAIGEAAEVIRRGDADVMVSGGTEAGFCELALACFSVGRAFSQRNDEPTKASRPFDVDRDGFVGGEGAGIVILERLTHALRRGAHIYAEVLGYGASNDGYHLIAPEPDGRGAARAMRWAIRNAQLVPEAVDYINAHATGTPLGDVAEVTAIKAVLGEHAEHVPISATKSMIGHLFGAAGGAEAIATIQTLRFGKIHPTANLDRVDPDCQMDHVRGRPRDAEVNVSMSNSFGLGGQNAVVVLARYLPDSTEL
jgi:3-oxoacyl-[acyl-carrier-protein] synthase II